MIKVKNLSHTYIKGQAPTLCNIDLEIKEGECVALIGPNGSGKTTLIRHLNALIMPQSGEVEIDGLKCSNTGHHVEIRRNVGMVFQNPDNQIVGMTVEEDVAFGPGNLNLPPQEIKRRVAASLQTVGLNGFEKRTPFSLSGGEKQLLAIAGLLAVNPKYIILDETTASLDPGSRADVFKILDHLKSQKVAIIHVTHDMEEAARADRVLLMWRGEIISDDTPGAILADREKLKSLGMAPPLLVELMSRLNISDRISARNILTLDEAVEFINLCLSGQTTNPGRQVTAEVSENV